MGSACCTAEKVPFPETPTLSRQTRPLQKNNCTIPRLTLRQSSSEISLGTGNHEHLASRSLSPQHLESSARLKISARGTSANGRSNGPSSRRKLYTAVPGRHFIAIRSHLPQASGEIALQKNDRVKVLSIGEGGYWEGICRGQVGWFPSKCVEEIPIRLGKERPKSRIELNNRKKLFRHFTVGSNDSFDSCSDCVAEQKIVVLQKQDSEGFGFVLRGAKADTPIEEFTPTAAFPALQYLESVDEGGVAWLMGLRTGDFLIEINHQNVVKLGHRQVVNMIRMGGNRLVIKVVRVSRNLDPDNKSCKKAPPPPKRAATTALSMRSKTLTPELEESDLGEKFQSQKPVQEKMLVDKIGLIKRPPSSRLLNLNGNTAAPPVPARAHGGFFGLSKGSMKRQKSIGNPEEEKKFLIPPSLRFNRSLSMPDKSEDIPPPPGVSPPSPPYKQSATMTRVYEPNQSIYTQTLIGKGHTIHRDHAGYRHTSEQYDSRVLSATLPNGATIPENPYSEESMKALYVPAKPVRRKGVLVKQPNVEDSPEKTCSIQIPTIIVKEPSTSSSGKSSQGSSMEIDLPTSTSPSQFSFEGSPNSSNPFAAAIAGAVRDREKRLEARKSIPAFMSLDLGDEDPFISPPCLRQSVSIDEAMFGNADSLQKHLALPTTLLEFQTIARGSRMISDNPELAEHLNRHRVTSPCLSTSVGLPPVINTSLSVRSPQHKVNEGTHDICLAARDNHVEQAQLFSKFDKANPNQPLFINTKLPSNPDANFVVSSEASLSGDCQRRLKNSPDFIQSTVKTKEGVPEKMKNYLGQQTSEGLLMVHTLEKTKSHVNQSDGFKQVIINANNPLNKPIDCIDKRVKNTVTVSHLPHLKSVTPRSSIIENVKVSFNIPPPLGSVDVDEEVDEEPLPPPLEFANSIDSVEDQKVEIPRRIKSCVTQANLSHYHSHVSKTDAGYKRLSGHGSYTSTLSYPPTLSEGFESVPQSERLGKRNNGESQFETNTTLSAVSSISTLSSVGIEDTFMVYSDGENILLEQPPVPPKPRMKPIINKSNAFCRNSLVEEIAESFGQLPPPPQECLEQSETHNALPHCGTNVCDDSIELPKPFGVNADPKANVINELSSKLQQLNKDRFPNQEESMAGAGLIDLRESDADNFCTSPGHLLLPGSSPVSPPSGPNTGHSSSLPTAVTSPTLTDNFSLPTPPIVNPEQCCSPSSSQCQSPPPFMTYHPGRPVQLWTKYDVADWLESLNLAEHRKAFMENEIDGSHLPNLLKDDLVDLGVSRVGHRMNIERALKHLMDDGM